MGERYFCDEQEQTCYVCFSSRSVLLRFFIVPSCWLCHHTCSYLSPAPAMRPCMPSILGQAAPRSLAVISPEMGRRGKLAAHASTQSRMAQQKANHRGRGGGAVPARIFAAETWGPRFAPWRLLALARTGHAVWFTHPPPGHSVAGCSVTLLLRTFLGCLHAGSLVLAFAGWPLHVSAWTRPD
jgi:hypothetical protein